MKKTIFALGIAAVAANLAAALPQVTNVSVAQDASRTVTVTYDLSSPGFVTVDFAESDGTPLSAIDTRITGDVGYVATAGTGKKAVWRPRMTLPAAQREKEFKNVKATVRAYHPARTPDYMVVDLANGNRRFYAAEGDLPGGVVANEEYRSTYLLMRRISVAWKEQMLGRANASWTSNQNPRRVRRAVMMTNDYYMSVFPVTRGQMARAYGWTQESQDKFTRAKHRTSNWKLRPEDGVGYITLRGNHESSTDAINWPETGDAVGNGTVLAKFRENTGILFDLPTDVQYEIACRAGSEGDLPGFGMVITNTVSDANASVYGWYKANWKDDATYPATSAETTHVVGLLQPNEWGLYDMCGNQRSFCRDWWCANPGKLADSYYEPKGPTQAQSEIVGDLPRRVSHSGGYGEDADLMMAPGRNPESISTVTSDYIGFRVVCPAFNGGQMQ